jgi:hypothetical protein
MSPAVQGLEAAVRDPFTRQVGVSIRDRADPYRTCR